VSEEETYAIVHCMLERSRSDPHYLTTTRTRASLFVVNFRGVLRKHNPEIEKHFEKLGCAVAE
jgi:hypothetical protein